MAGVKYIAFRLGDQKYAIKLSKINGLEPIYDMSPVPMGAENLKGIVRIRDLVVPIYDLKGSFGIYDSGRTAKSQLLVMELRGIKMGIEVDDVLGIVEVEKEDINQVPFVVHNDKTDYLENVVKITLPETTKSEIVVSINIDELLTEKEAEGVREAIFDKEKEEKEE